MIDLHCHVLAGIDDGPATIEDAVAICRAAHDSGTQTLVSTSHVSWDYPENNAVTVHMGVAALNVRLKQEGVDVRVLPGAELGLSRVADLSDAEIGVLRLGAGPYALLECPHHGGAAIGIEDAVRSFARRGHRVVLAHPERSAALRGDRRLISRLIDDGMLSCVTARSLTGDHGATAQESGWDLLDARLVHVLASDAHNVERRAPDLGPTLERAGLTEAEIDYFAREAPDAIIHGRSVPPPPRIPAARSGRRSRRGLLGRLTSGR